MTFNLSGVMTDADIQDLQERNQSRVQAAIQAMGTRYLCHPANRIQRNSPDPDQRPLNEVARMLSASFS